MNQRIGLLYGAVVCVAMALPASVAGAATVAHYTNSGIVDMGNPQGWGSSNITGDSVAFEVNFDFTPAVDGVTAPIVLWEAGATGSGAALVLLGDQLHFFAGNEATDVTTGDHGLVATQAGVQVVSVFERDAGLNGTDEVLSIYVNGALKASADTATANIWAGSDPGGLGREGNSAPRARYLGTSLFDDADIVNFPESDISFAIYQLASSGGPADNTLENILIPEPGSLALLGFAGLLIARRRRG